VKKITAIFFFTVYVFSTTEAHQLLKLPVIFEHYAEHQQEDMHISFLQFLDMHYLHGSPNDKDYERDMELPFKTADGCICAISPAFVPFIMLAPAAEPVEVILQKIFILKDQRIQSSYLSNIWQPPK